MSDSIERNSISPPPGNDEVHLVDLLVVLLRRRWIILGFTLAAVILGAALVLFLPRGKYRESLEKEVILKEERFRGVLTCGLSPEVVSFYDRLQAEEFILMALNDPVLLMNSLRANGIENIAGVSLGEGREDELIFSLRQRLVNNKSAAGVLLKDEDRVFTVVRENSGLFRVSIIMEDREMAVKFLLTLFEEANRRLDELLLPSARAEVLTFEDFSRLQYPGKTAEQDLVSVFYRYKAAQRFVSDEIKALFLVQSHYEFIPTKTDPVIVSVAGIRKSLTTRAIIAVVAVFFLSVMLVFILQAVENVRKDPAAMAKIRGAVRNKKD